MTNPINIILTILVYDYSNIGSSLVVYIVHKGIISLIFCGYEVHMNILEENGIIHICETKL